MTKKPNGPVTLAKAEENHALAQRRVSQLQQEKAETHSQGEHRELTEELGLAQADLEFAEKQLERLRAEAAEAQREAKRLELVDLSKATSIAALRKAVAKDIASVADAHAAIRQALDRIQETTAAFERRHAHAWALAREIGITPELPANLAAAPRVHLELAQKLRGRSAVARFVPELPDSDLELVRFAAKILGVSTLDPDRYGWPAEAQLLAMRDGSYAQRASALLAEYQAEAEKAKERAAKLDEERRKAKEPSELGHGSRSGGWMHQGDLPTFSSNGYSPFGGGGRAA